MEKRNLNAIQEIVFKATKKAGFEVNIEDIRIDKTKTIEHGHFSCNSAMLLAGKAGKRPRDVAEDIISNLDKSIFEKVEIAGPGFINFWVEHKFYTTECQSLIENFDD